MTLKYFPFLLFFFISSYSFAQDRIFLKGEVLNKITKEEVPFAHIKLINTSLGTVSNGNGEFSLVVPGDYASKELQISSIGYKSKRVKIPSASQEPHHFTILLEEEPSLLNAVTIVSGNIARGIVEKAIDRIDLNYPGARESLKGFFREQASEDSAHLNPYYVAEAVIEVAKDSYGQKVKQGAVKLIKGRKYIGPAYGSLQTRFYAGAHLPHRYDFVISREGPLNKRNLENYSFQILDTVKYENESLIVISFESLKGTKGKGSLYIASESYAFVKGVFLFDEEFREDMLNQFRGLVGDYERYYSRHITEYSQQDSLWRLKFTEYHSGFKRGEEEELHVNSVFVTTDFDTAHEEIPYAERIHFHDVFLKKTGVYDEGFWDGYNVISPESSHEKIITQEKKGWNNRKGKSKLDAVLSVLARVRVSYGLSYFKAEASPGEVSFSNSALQVNEKTGRASVLDFGLIASNVAYELSDQWKIGLENYSSFSSTAFSANAFFISWEKNLRPQKRPVFISPGFKIGHFSQQAKVKEYQAEEIFFINGKKFDSGKGEVFAESRAYYLSPSVSLSLEKNKRIRYFIEAGYYFPFKERNGLHFYEKDQFFLKRKNEFLKSTIAEPLIKPNSNSLFKNDFLISAGITITY